MSFSFSTGLICFMCAATLTNTFGILYLLRSFEVRVRAHQEILLAFLNKENKDNKSE